MFEDARGRVSRAPQSSRENTCDRGEHMHADVDVDVDYERGRAWMTRNHAKGDGHDEE